MSDLEFFDIFRMFLGELQNRDYDMGQRSQVMQAVIGSLKDVLANAPTQQQNAFASSGSGQNLYQQSFQQPPQQFQQQQQQQYQPPPQQYQAPPQQQQQYYQEPQQQQQHYQPDPPQQQYQQAPPQQEHYEEPQQQQQQAAAMSDVDAITMISAAVYGAGPRLMNVYKTLNTTGSGISPDELVDGLHKMNIDTSAEQIKRLCDPFLKDGTLNYSGFVRFLASGKN